MTSIEPAPVARQGEDATPEAADPAVTDGEVTDAALATEPASEDGSPARQRSVMLVAGSGRSGTSVFTGIVGQLGFHIPQPEVQADETNPRGFGEPRWVVDQHVKLLRRANVHASDARPSAWADTARTSLEEDVEAPVRTWLEALLATHRHVVIKDPRLLWFLPLWNRAARNAGASVHVVTLLRHPAEVVRSKSTWYSNMTLTDANRVAGWLNTMLFTERATREYQRLMLRFEDLLDDWTQPIARVSQEFDLPVLVNARAQAQAAADLVIDKSLHRSRASWDELDAPDALIDLADHVWTELLALADPDAQDVSGVLARLDQYREEYVSYYWYAECVAQSTTQASLREVQRKFSAQRTAQQQARLEAAAPAEPAAPPPPPRSDALLVRIVRRVPLRLRRLIPLRLRRGALDPFRT